MTEEIPEVSGWTESSEDFVVGPDNFADLQVNSTPVKQFYYFRHQKGGRLIKQFVLDRKPKVDYLCQVTLIKKGDKFTPRLSLSVRDKKRKIEDFQGKETNLKASVSLTHCYDAFWKLVSFLQSLRDIEIPIETFSLISQDEGEIVSALRSRGVDSVATIIRQLSKSPGISLTHKDINALLKRREKLAEFKNAIAAHKADESWWQNFFENNKWIFGYGLNYQILRQEQAQASYGGSRLDGTGGERGDFLTSTMGDIRFTVLVEIKTPATLLLQGTKEIRNGAWSLSKALTDGISQLQANISIWDKRGSELPENRDRLEAKKIFTVQPKGILVTGVLGELKERSKKETFQRFRESVTGVDILTFDELYERAKYIVENE